MRTRHVVAVYALTWTTLFGLFLLLVRLAGPLYARTDVCFSMASAGAAIIAALVVLRVDRHLSRPHL